MVHNGIEYGVMAAYAEGLNILKNANAGTVERDADAETAPLEHPEYYQYELDIAWVTEVWRRGSVIASWLLDLTAAALQESPDLREYRLHRPRRADQDRAQARNARLRRAGHARAGDCVGDTPHDVDGAHAAGMARIGVGRHNFDVDLLRAAGADYVIVSLTEALPL
jgi:HAD-hyrolase-like protein